MMSSVIKLIFQIIAILILLLNLLSCDKEVSPYQLSDEQLANIITDIHISESATQNLSLAFRDSMVLIYLDQILEIHEVPKEIFEPDYQKLKKDPGKLQLIYGKVIDRLNSLKLNKDKKGKQKNQKTAASTKKDLSPKKK